MPQPENFNPLPPASPWDVLTVADVAKWLQCSPQYVRNVAEKGTLAAFRLGSHWRFERADVAEFIQKAKAEAA